MNVTKVIKKRQTILYQGDTIQGGYIVKRGFVRAYSILENGNEATVEMFGPGDAFPITSEYNQLSEFYYEANKDSVVEQLGQEEFTQYINQRQENIGQKIYNSVLRVNALIQQNARMKIAHTLRLLSVRFGEPLLDKKRIKIPFKITQADIARLCGLSRETTSIELDKLRSQNVFTQKEKHYVVNKKTLEHYIEEPSTKSGK